MSNDLCCECGARLVRRFAIFWREMEDSSVDDWKAVPELFHAEFAAEEEIDNSDLAHKQTSVEKIYLPK